MSLPPRLVAVFAAVALLADLPGLFTRGDVLRGVVVTFLAALVAALGALLPGGRGPRKPRLVLAMLPLVVPGLGLVALEGATAAGVLRLAAPWIALSALGVGALLLWQRDEERDLTWGALLLAGAVAGGWVLVDGLVRGAAGVGPFGRPGIAGPVLASLLAVAWVHPVLRRPWVRRVVLALLAAGLVSTFSRVGLAAGVLGSVGTLGLAHAGRAGLWLRRAFVAVAAAGVLLLALAVAGHARIPGGGDTLDVRLGLYRASTRLIAEAPLVGHGLGSFPAEILRVRDPDEARRSRGRRPLVGHDDYLHATTEGGVLAGLALIVWLAGLLGVGLATLKGAERTARGRVAAVMGALLTIAIAALGENVLLDPAITLIAGFAVAAILGAANRRAAPAGKIPRALTIALALLALLAAGVKGRDLISDVHLRRYQEGLAAPQGPLAAILAARDELERGALRWRPDSAIAWYRLGVARATLKDPAQAREAYAKALAADPGMTEARLDTAQTHAAEGVPAAAREVLEEALRHDPTRFDVRIRLGHLAMGEEPIPGEASGADHDPVAALRAYNEAGRLAPDRFEIRVAQARLARRRGELPDAGEHLRAALESVAPDAARILRTPPPDDPRARQAMAGKMVARQRDALNALALHPESAEILLESFRLAELERKAPDLWVAGFLKLALLVNPRLAGAMETEARRFLEIARAREEDAQTAVEGSLIKPDYRRADRAFDAAALRLAALLHAELIDPDRVLREARQDAEAKAWRLANARYRALLSHAAALPPARGEGRARQLDVLAELYSESAKVATRIDSARARHAYARARATRGAAHLVRGEWAQAREWLGRAAEDAPEDAEVRLALARALLQLDALDEAEASLLEALRLAPGLAEGVRADPDMLPLLQRERVREALDR